MPETATAPVVDGRLPELDQAPWHGFKLPLLMHPPALAFSLSAGCVAPATVRHLSAQDGQVALHARSIIIFLSMLMSMSVPVTTTLLARTDRFRAPTSPHRRAAGDPPGREAGGD